MFKHTLYFGILLIINIRVQQQNRTFSTADDTRKKTYTHMPANAYTFTYFFLLFKPERTSYIIKHCYYILV